MKTLFNIVVPLFYQECPRGQTKNTCALRSFLKRKDGVYVHFDYRLSPNTTDWVQARDAINHMYAICNNCKTKNKR